ncbi:MAG: hypothetical protein Q9217_005086 [Psora testacea]
MMKSPSSADLTFDCNTGVGIGSENTQSTSHATGSQRINPGRARWAVELDSEDNDYGNLPSLEDLLNQDFPTPSSMRNPELGASRGEPTITPYRSSALMIAAPPIDVDSVNEDDSSSTSRSESARGSSSDSPAETSSVGSLGFCSSSEGGRGQAPRPLNQQNHPLEQRHIMVSLKSDLDVGKSPPVVTLSDTPSRDQWTHIDTFNFALGGNAARLAASSEMLSPRSSQAFRAKQVTHLHGDLSYELLEQSTSQPSHLNPPPPIPTSSVPCNDPSRRNLQSRRAVVCKTEASRKSLRHKPNNGAVVRHTVTPRRAPPRKRLQQDQIQRGRLDRDWEIERIAGVRQTSQGLEYSVVWKESWIPARQLGNAQETVAEYIMKALAPSGGCSRNVGRQCRGQAAAGSGRRSG